MARGTTNRNQRGSSKDRAARKKWLLKTYAADERLYNSANVGVETCRCYRCGELLTFDTMTVDRIIPGCRGGRYVRNNVRPACAECNEKTGGAERSKITR